MKRKVRQSSDNLDISQFDKISELEAKVKNLNKENKYLQELASLLQDHEIITFQNGRYVVDIREALSNFLI